MSGAPGDVRTPILDLENVTMTFGGLRAVDGLSFTVFDGEIVGLIGPNGAGKTTVFNCVTQFYKQYEGTIRLTNDGRAVDLRSVPVTHVVRHGVARTFQNLDLVPDLSIEDNVLIGAHTLFATGVIAHLLRTPRARREEVEMRERAAEVLDFLGIAHLKDLYVAGQPYGVLKKVEIARTLMANPRLIILDEPAAGLNDRETDALDALIYQIRERFNTTILLIEHDMGLVMNVCDRVCAINFGKFLAMGTPATIQRNPQVQEAYLGKDEDL
ncbi:MAG: ABC transporter ATP-binding protein [Spirochaetaceae bacterium]|nr:MAG: ABC transporter ATP-binding protein [Spirochaetaceae bacterium]